MKKRYVSKVKRIVSGRIILLIIVAAVSFIIPCIFLWNKILNIDNEEAVVEIFGIIVSAVGAMFVVFELDESGRIECCDNMADLNMKFIENPRLMFLYQELSKCANDPAYELPLDKSGKYNPNMIQPSDFMAYMTFYEVINEFVKNGVMDIQQMDDLFGDRFFKIVHNSYVQKHELYAEPSSYVNIFELYSIWKTYRIKNTKADRMIVSSQNTIPELYFSEKLYLKETTRFCLDGKKVTLTNKKENKSIDFWMRRLFPSDIDEVMAFQKKIVDGISDKSIFEQTTKEEFLESMLIDFCYGLYENDMLAAVCIIVLNRKTETKHLHERNLCVQLSDNSDYSDYISFDTIQVADGYRGYGIQSFFLKEAERVAQQCGAKNIIATVSSKNANSKRNFELQGYSVKKEINIYNKERCLVLKSI